MSSNQTENLNLHQWEASDTFSRTEFNENSAKIDAKFAKVDANFTKMDAKCAALAESITATQSQIPRIVSGSYTGNGGTIQINLGFRPRAVVISSYGYAAILQPEATAGSMLLDDGFQVLSGGVIDFNRNGSRYSYLAVR